jgi:hypothetical protein
VTAALNRMRRRLVGTALTIALSIASAYPSVAQEPTCPANSSPVGTTVSSNGDRELQCHCNRGYANKGGVCAPEPQIGNAIVTGKAYLVDAAGTKYPLTSRDTVRLNDHVVTGRNGRLDVSLLDGTTFHLGPNSDMVLDEFVYDPATSVGKVMARLVKGLFRYVTGKVARRDPQSMKVRLPFGTLGHRGTEVLVDIGDDGAGYIVLYKGLADLTEAKTGRRFPLRPGQMIVFDRAGPHPARPVDPRIVRQP